MTFTALPPPALEDLPAGFVLVAGAGFSTVLPDADFETSSEAGFVWDADGQKWRAPDGNQPQNNGIGAVGVACYTEHPSTEVLSLAYDLKDGRGRRRWIPGQPPPHDLFAHIAAGGLLEAWNSGFEFWVWSNVCVPKYGWPPLPLRQMRCAMAKARAHGWPGKLDNASTVLNLTHKKDQDGKRLLTKFSRPRNPTKTDPRLWIRPEEDPADAERLYSYNETDIRAEAEASSKTPDLQPDELEFWLADQEINIRGVAVDTASIDHAIAIISEAYTRYNAELRAITGGAVEQATQLERLKGWLAGRGVHMDDMDADAIEATIKTWPPSPERRTLEIRAAIGSASVKKLYALRNQTTRAGRVHDLFSFHAARTGRATGNGPQPQNLFKGGPEVWRCRCGRHFGAHTMVCPWCAAPYVQRIVNGAPEKPAEWSALAAADALDVIAFRSLDLLEIFFGDALLAVCGCLRAMFVASPGHDLIASDYNAIEAVVLAALAGEEWRLEIFRTHGKIYEASASAITGISMEEYARYRKETGQHHPTRGKTGKVGELACFGPYTQVLTNRGYVSIKDVRKQDLLWDGIEWVSHAGVVPKGEKTVLHLDGVKMTPQHPVSTGRFWKEAHLLVSNENFRSQALAFGSKNLPSSVRQPAKKSWSFVRAGASLTKWFGAIFARENLPAATCALKRKVGKLSKIIGHMRALCPTFSTVGGFSIESQLAFNGAKIPKMLLMKTMVAGAFGSSLRGFGTEKLFWAISSRYPAGIFRRLSWTAKKWMADTNRATFGLSPVGRIKAIAAKFRSCKNILNCLSPVFDIVNAGPRNRFTIKTNSGHLIVHNSGYGGWIGAWKNFGAGEFFTDDEIKQNILAWRAASPSIVEMWGGQSRGKPWASDFRKEYFGLEGMAIQAVLNPGQELTFLAPHPDAQPITYFVRGDVLYCRLPSGRLIAYQEPRLRQSTRAYKEHELSLSFMGWNTNPKMGPTGWVRMETYGGKLTENVVQAVARDILRDAILRLRAEMYDVVLHVHDEIVVDVPQNLGSVEDVERLMMAHAPWCASWPVKASGGWRGFRYRKE